MLFLGRSKTNFTSNHVSTAVLTIFGHRIVPKMQTWVKGQLPRVLRGQVQFCVEYVILERTQKNGSFPRAVCFGVCALCSAKLKG